MDYDVITEALRSCKFKTDCDECNIKTQCYRAGNFVEDYAANVIDSLADELRKLKKQRAKMKGKCGACFYAEPHSIKKDGREPAYIRCTHPENNMRWTGVNAGKAIKQRCAKGCLQYKERDN